MCSIPWWSACWRFISTRCPFRGAIRRKSECSRSFGTGLGVELDAHAPEHRDIPLPTLAHKRRRIHLRHAPACEWSWKGL